MVYSIVPAPIGNRGISFSKAELLLYGSSTDELRQEPKIPVFSASASRDYSGMNADLLGEGYDGHGRGVYIDLTDLTGCPLRWGY